MRGNADAESERVEVSANAHADGSAEAADSACASCRHVDGVCIDHDSGSGCHACEGPVAEPCDLTEALEDDEPNARLDRPEWARKDQ
jgi:hypothetical protein